MDKDEIVWMSIYSSVVATMSVGFIKAHNREPDEDAMHLIIRTAEHIADCHKKVIGN